MIYRILTNGTTYNDKRGSVRERKGLMGAYTAGVALPWGLLPMPNVSNSRVRFYFTELGWNEYGRAILRQAGKRKMFVRVVRLKNPSASCIVYKDKWQIALLPAEKSHGR